MSEQRAYTPLPPAPTPLPPQSGLPQAPSPIDSALALGGRAQLPPSNVGASLPTPQVQPLDTSSPTAKAPPQVSDPLGYAYNVIGQGETGSDPDAAHRLYGARPSYFGFPDFHATGPSGAPTSAAGKVQWEADTWKGAATAYVNAGNPTPDFNKAEDQEKVFRFWAPIKYTEVTHGRNLAQDIAAGVDWKTPLAATWPSLVPHSLHNPARPDLNGIITAGQQTGNEIRQSMLSSMNAAQAQMEEYKRIAESAPPGSKEMNDALARQTEASERAAKSFDELAAHPPIYTPKDIMQRFGSLATVIAVLGGLKSRQPLTAALNASGQAMKALNQNNYDDYKIAYDAWKTQTDLVVQSLRAHSEAINQILSNKRFSQEEKNSELNALATSIGNEFLKAKVNAGAIEAPYRIQLDTMQATEHMVELQNQTARLNDALEKGKAQQEHIELQNEALRAELAPLQHGMSPQQAGPWPGMPNTPPPGMDPGIWSYALEWVETGKQPPFGRANSPQRIMFNQAVPLAQKALGVEPSKQDAEWIKYQAMQRRETAIETGFGPGAVTGRNLISLNTVADHIELLREYADALNNKSGPVVVNSIINRMSTQAGMPEVIQAALAKTITADEAVRLLTSTGGTVEDREGIQKLLNEYGSPAQLKAGIDTLSNYVRGRYDPLRQAFARGDPAREEYFNNSLVTPQARALFSGPAAPIAGARRGLVQSTPSTPRRSVPVPKEHAKDPDGTTYNKGEWVKQGNQMISTQ